MGWRPSNLYLQLTPLLQTPASFLTSPLDHLTDRFNLIHHRLNSWLPPPPQISFLLQWEWPSQRMATPSRWVLRTENLGIILFLFSHTLHSNHQQILFTLLQNLSKIWPLLIASTIRQSYNHLSSRLWRRLPDLVCLLPHMCPSALRPARGQTQLMSFLCKKSSNRSHLIQSDSPCPYTAYPNSKWNRHGLLKLEE